MLVTMSRLQKFAGKCTPSVFSKQCLVNTFSIRECANTTVKSETDGDEFRVLDLRKTRTGQSTQQRRRQVPEVAPPRASRMPVDQDWTNVWPGARTFHPASVPLPLRQGINKLGAAPNKYANLELMKIPNFLHLTPPAIKKHCEALKKFCTPWPEALKTDELCAKHFPLEVISTDYCHSSPSIRNPLSRIVTIKVPLSRLQLDAHARDKLLRLVGDRYDQESDIITIVADKCPLRQQNYDYALYLLTALYHESWNYEPWEQQKSEADLEYYDWDNSQSRKNVQYICEQTSEKFDIDSSKIKNYKEAVISLFDEGENDYNLAKYKEASLKVLFPQLEN